MKVLQLGKFYDPYVGGMETVLKEICESLADQVDFQVVVANTRARTEHENRKVPVTRVASMGKLFSCSMAPTYPLWARKFDADLIHVHIPNPLAELSALIADRDIPVVAQFHSDVVRQRNLLRLYGPFLDAFYRRANSIIVPTPRHIEISAFVSKYREKCRVVPFGVPLSRFELDETGLNKVDELRDGLPSVLCVGRLVSYKGVEFLIRALENVKARLWIIGTGPLEDSLKNLAREKGLGDRVEFLGQVIRPGIGSLLPRLRCVRASIRHERGDVRGGAARGDGVPQAGDLNRPADRCAVGKPARKNRFCGSTWKCWGISERHTTPVEQCRTSRRNGRGWPHARRAAFYRDKDGSGPTAGLSGDVERALPS